MLSVATANYRRVLGLKQVTTVLSSPNANPGVCLVQKWYTKLVSTISNAFLISKLLFVLVFEIPCT
jgi:hypothetical protein